MIMPWIDTKQQQKLWFDVMNSESQSAAAFADSFASLITPGERDARKGEREREGGGQPHPKNMRCYLI